MTTDDHFRSTTTVRFRAAEPGSTTFAELKPVRPAAATLNGTPLQPATLDGNRLRP